MSSVNQKKIRQYSVEYLKLGFITSPNNIQKPLCLIYEKEFSSDSMKPSRFKNHFDKMHASKVKQDLYLFQNLNIEK